jgi:hypothetical protein
MDSEETGLQQAARHVVKGRDIVERQRQLIADLKRTGVPAQLAEETLQTFEENLAIFERHERELRAKAGRT